VSFNGLRRFGNHATDLVICRKSAWRRNTQLRIGPFRCIVAGLRLVGMLPIRWALTVQGQAAEATDGFI
jgi:hypothetical protein